MGTKLIMLNVDLDQPAYFGCFKNKVFRADVCDEFECAAVFQVKGRDICAINDIRNDEGETINEFVILEIPE